MTRREHRARYRECPSCGRLTAYRREWTPILGRPSPPLIFRPHNDPATGARCPGSRS